MRKLFRCFLTLFLVLFCTILLFLLIMNDKFEDVRDDFLLNDYLNNNDEESKPRHEQNDPIPNETVTEPIILWWTPFTGDAGLYKKCGDVKCFFTNNRLYKDHDKLQAFMFYGTDFKPFDLPVPRKPNHDWGLLHEESPKNNYLFSHEEIMELFNYTSTFRRESSYPIPTQYVDSIKWLEDQTYFVPIKEKNKFLSELSPIMYTQSDCDVPSGRDQYTKMLMEYINVDSYGTCLHNKDLPANLRDPIEGMDHMEFYKLNAKYKFSLAMENGLCPDYMTEKLWRPFHLGSVPIILGSPKVKDFLPSNHSAIVVEDFKTVKELADYIKYLNDNDEEYARYLEWKSKGVRNQYLKKELSEREWSVQSNWEEATINFIEGFQCYVCKKIHEKNERVRNKKEPVKCQATKDHYGCPGPVSYHDDGRRKEGGSSSWDYEFKKSKYLALAVNRLISLGQNFSKKDLFQLAKIIKDELR
ncbi:alpha-(1,3)-fucosyltransferase 10-like [Mytilus californianus]|uniref:alpha-(1,3)-fucosyltransferase 10-like n=1 Tax=Mytilus californianus TaxID=6549 RepID=UPI0022479B46|nr:alpha-(1,3)-fucosyltransferase 10-like [Mytilus californianus]